MTKKQDPRKVAYQEAVKEFRNKYIEELDKTMDFFIKIRDDTEVSAQERNKAGIAIGKMLGSWQPDRTATKKEEKTSTIQFEATPPKLRQELQEKIKELTPSDAVE